MVTCVRGDGKGRAAARAHRGLSLDGEWGERESSQARVPVMRDDIDSWSRPRLAERLSVVGLRAHVAGDARPQLTRRGDDDGEEHHGGEEVHCIFRDAWSIPRLKRYQRNHERILHSRLDVPGSRMVLGILRK